MHDLWDGPQILHFVQDDTCKAYIFLQRDLTLSQSAQADFVSIARGFNRRAFPLRDQDCRHRSFWLMPFVTPRRLTIRKPSRNIRGYGCYLT
jgi:hypothetical protein